MTELFEAEDEQAMPYALARGDVEELVKFYAARGKNSV
jgi:hypothetical protein